MNFTDYFTDLGVQLTAVKNRIRQFIGGVHWPSDGAWKESALRAVLRNYLPNSMSVCSGFILTSDGVSTQIDILILDDSGPVFFRDGDFVIAPPEVVRAAIEVKTSLTAYKLRAALRKLNSISEKLNDGPFRYNRFLGLFSYEPFSGGMTAVLELLKRHNGDRYKSAITALSFGDSQFVRFWEFEPPATSGRPYHSWHAYKLDRLAIGYFVHNVVQSLFPNEPGHKKGMWFPEQSKEGMMLATKARFDT